MLRTTFQQIGASPSVAERLKLLNVVHPNKTQMALFPALLSHKDLSLKDITGSGKTIGLVSALLSKGGSVLYLVPTRELAIQVTMLIRQLDPNCNVQCIVSNGLDIDPSPAKIIVGTPVRLFEQFKANRLDFTALQLVIVDDVDRIVQLKTPHVLPGEALISAIVYKRQKSSKAFQHHFDNPISKRLQVDVASATINHGLKWKLKSLKWLSDPLHLSMSGLHITPKIEHLAYFINQDGKSCPVTLDPILAKHQIDAPQVLPNYPPALPDDHPIIISLLADLLKSPDVKNAFVFANSSSSITKLVNSLKSHGIRAEKLFNLVDYASFTGFEKVVSGSVNVLVCTEYEARGLDIPMVSHVFILGLPANTASYLHMSGRTARNNTFGTCISIFGGERYVPRYQNMLRLLRLAK